MKVGDLVYNHSIEMRGVIVEELVTTGLKPSKLHWFVLLLEDGGTERANNLELEVITDGFFENV